MKHLKECKCVLELKKREFRKELKTPFLFLSEVYQIQEDYKANNIMREFIFKLNELFIEKINNINRNF